MDPNATLSELRDLLRQWQKTPEGTPENAELSGAIAERFAALDEWMSRGGFAPSGWAHHR